jgi:hypothetical protein
MVIIVLEVLQLALESARGHALVYAAGLPEAWKVSSALARIPMAGWQALPLGQFIQMTRRHPCEDPRLLVISRFLP